MVLEDRSGLTTRHLIGALSTTTVDATTHPTGGDSVSSKPDLALLNVGDPDSAAQVADVLRRQGIVFVSGVPDRSQLLSSGRGLMAIRRHPDSDDDGVTTIERRFSTAMGSLAGFTDRELVPHTDGSAVAAPPRMLMLVCQRRPSSGGQVLLVDCSGLYHEIASSDTAMLEALSAPRSAYFGGGSGHLGSVFQGLDDHRVAARLRFDDLIRFSPAASLYAARLRELVHQRTITVDLGVGEGYVLLNDRWLHGRRPFAGDRTMLRLIGDPLPEHHIVPGFTPARTGTPLPMR